MRLKHKKIFISGVALTVAGVLGVGALLQSSVSVQASSAMMPGIEQIVGEVSEEEPFRILEIVDSKADAEIGYYVSGQEPYIKLYEYQIKDEEGNVKETIHFSTLEEGLSKLPSGRLREEFARNVKFNTDENGNLVTDENGNPTFTSSDIRDIFDISYKGGESESSDPVLDYPLSYTDYEEKYFLEEGESTETGWNQIDFVDFEGQPRVDKVSLAGTYMENPSGNGNYTKQEQSYYPIRNDRDKENDAAKFRENIQNFFYSEGDDTRAPYDLKFAEVSNDTVNEVLAGRYQDGKNPILEEYDYAQGRYGYYENVYADLTTELADKPTSFPGEKTETEAGVLIQNNENLATTELFSAGDAELFGSAESGSAEPDSGDKIFGADAVGDEVVFDNDTDVFSDDVFTTDTIENNEPVENIEPAENSSTPDVLADGNEEDTVKEPTILGIIQDVKTAGTQSNPYIYLGKSIEEYPNYMYTKVGDLAYVKAMAEKSAEADKQNIEEGNPIKRTVGDITIENDQYWYWEQVGSAGDDLVKQPLSVVTGRQPVAYNHIRPISEKLDYSYYYRVEEAYFCCKLPDGGDENNPQSYQYFGWYFPSYPANESVYLPVEEDRTPTHYISDAVYKLTPGNGNYDFVHGGGETCEVEVNHAYYRGGYVNNDWLKRYVFHLSPTAQSMNSETAEEGQAVSDEEARKQFDNFAIEVDTFTAEELNAVLSGTAKQAEDEYQVADPDQTEDEYQASDTEQMESGETADADQTENGDQVSATDENQTEGETQAPDESQMPDEDQTSDENQSSEQENGNMDTYADEVMVFGEGEVSQVEPMVSEVMEELVGPQADQLFSDSDGQTQTEQTQAEQTQQTQAEQEPDADSLFSDAENTEPEVTFSSDDAAVFSSGSEAKDTENDGGFQLSDYDLIYINGNSISQEAANALAESRIPCIINQDKMIGEGQSEELNSVEAAFSEFLHEDDEDGHYVNQYVYFFKNTFKDSNETAPGSGSNLVNLHFHTPFYTESGQSTFSDSTVPEVPQGFEEIRDYIDSENQYRGLEEGIEPLSYDISQARVVEYILNYKLKRNVKLKDEINVLEIQPTNGNNVLTEDDVLDWLGISSNIRIKDYCCQQNEKESIQKIFDGNKETMWHSQYDISHKHHFTVKLPDSFKNVKGISYLPRKTEDNGIAKIMEIDLYNATMEIIKSYEASFEKNNRLKEFKFGASVEKVKYITITFKETYGNPKNMFASCAEFNVIGDRDSELDSTDIPDIKITRMTSSEYVGHIDDINSKYDLIYIGDDDSNRDSLINGDAPMLYTHVGGNIVATGGEKGNGKNSHLGLMDFDKTLSDGEQPKPVIQDLNHAIGGIGSLRGSGNDITKQQYQELMDFVISGYPVIMGSKLTTKTSNSVIDINNKYVDSSSYIYKFLDEAKKYDNVMLYDDLSEESLLPFFANLAKPVIDFTEGAKPPEPPRLNETHENSGYITGEGLEYVFAIKNDSDVAPAANTYDCELYLDLNFDGNLASNEEQDKYVQITDLSNNQVLTNTDGKFELKLGRKYKLTRKIPYDYFKVITWKLQICSNTNHSVRTSVMGYAKRENKGEPVEINVLQIAPNISAVANDKNRGEREEFGTWNLTYKDSEKNNYLKQTKDSFQKLLAQVDDFAINIDVKKIGTQDSHPKNTFLGDYISNLAKGKNLLDNYDMIIIGFDDVYEDIPNLPNDGIGAVDAIKKFTQSGKSVIFAHDTTSYVNTDYNIYGNRTKSGENLKDIFQKRNNWGYSMNSILRPIVGLDRYGITSEAEITKDKTNTTIGKLLRGQAAGTRLTSDEVDYSNLKKYAGDVAYATNTLNSSFIETQGFTNWELRTKEAPRVYSASKVNDGAVTQYPYLLGDLITTETHAQYYQLALEKDYDINGFSDGKNDIVVWYCLSGDDYTNLSPNDVRNSYYFYSCGNVIYTGAGHQYMENPDNNLSEKQLFVNAIIAAAGVTAVNPEVNFVKMLNPSAEKEGTRYYMTDQAFFLSDEKNILEDDMEFYFNVKDYNMVSASLNSEDKDKQDMTVEFYIENEKGSILKPEEGEVIPTNEKLLEITNSIAGLEQYGNANKIGKGEDGKFHLKKNNAYSFVLKDVESYLYEETGNQYKSDCKLYIKVTSTVYLYGKPVKKSSWASLDVKQRQLFDLD